MKISTTAGLLLGVLMTASTAMIRIEAIPYQSSQKFGKSAKLEKFDKALKHDKDSKKAKFEKADKPKHWSKSEKKSKKGKSDKYDDDFFSDDFWDDECFFNDFSNDAEGGFPDMDGASLCIEDFAKNAFLQIDIDKALDCSESLEKIAWKSFPSCFELRYYTPYLCEELYQKFDKAYECFYDLLWEPQCYFDDTPESLDGCAISFATSFDLDVENFLDCSIDFHGELDEKCYSNENSLESCDTFFQCESVLYSAEYCSYDTGIDLHHVAAILEQELGVRDFLETIYDGSVDLGEVLDVLMEYEGLTGANELQWSEYAECMVWEIGWLIDDFCFVEAISDIVGGCVEHFADSHDDLNTEDLLTCSVDFEEKLEEKCFGDDYEANLDSCVALDQCAFLTIEIDYCVKSIFGIDISDLAGVLAESEFSDILSSIYDGTVELSDVINRFETYDGMLSDVPGWDDFVDCIGDLDTLF